MDSLKRKTFELLVEMMDSAGGDGDSALLCDEPTLAADAFEKWAKETHPNRFVRHNNEDSIVFQGEGVGRQEGVTFLDYDHELKNSPNSHWCEGIIRTLLF